MQVLFSYSFLLPSHTSHTAALHHAILFSQNALRNAYPLLSITMRTWASYFITRLHFTSKLCKLNPERRMWLFGKGTAVKTLSLLIKNATSFKIINQSGFTSKTKHIELFISLLFINHLIIMLQISGNLHVCVGAIKDAQIDNYVE